MERCCVYYKNRHAVRLIFQFVSTSKKRQTGITGAFIPESNPFPHFFCSYSLLKNSPNLQTHPQLIIYIFFAKATRLF